MKLYSAPLSPFARKVRIMAIELGLAERLELVHQSVNPVTPDESFQATGNPLGKIPALLTDEGQTLYDSHVIAAYLDALAGGQGLVPADRRWQILTHQALASGMTDAAILVRYELALRPADKQWPAWVRGQWSKFEEGLRAFESAAAGPASPLSEGEPDQMVIDLAQIALASGLSYVDVRFPDLGWRDRAPRVAAWHETIERRASFIATAPPRS